MVTFGCMKTYVAANLRCDVCIGEIVPFEGATRAAIIDRAKAMGWLFLHARPFCVGPCCARTEAKQAA